MADTGSSLRLKNITVTAGGAPLVTNATLEVRTGELAALLGPNGAGKTTLMRAAAGLIPVQGGLAMLNGSPVGTFSHRDRAQALAYLPQIRPIAWPNCVRDVVALGRFAHGVSLGKLSGADADAVDRALDACDLTALAHRRMDTLSGGEIGRVHCARAFAAEAPILLADEPVAALDPRHQYQIMGLVRRFVDQGGGALVILHDVALAARFVDRMVWMTGGRIVADGPPGETLTSARMEAVYGVRAQIDPHPDGPVIRIDGPS